MARKPIDTEKLARALGAVHVGSVPVHHGPFGATLLAEEVRARFRSPETGGRSTNPEWSEQRLVKLAPATLRKLEAIARDVTASGQPVAPLQVAALLLERAVSAADDGEVLRLARKRTA